MHYNQLKDAILDNSELVDHVAYFVEEVPPRNMSADHRMIDIVKHYPFLILFQLLQEGKLLDRLECPLLQRVIIVHLQYEASHLNIQLRDLAAKLLVVFLRQLSVGTIALGGDCCSSRTLIDHSDLSKVLARCDFAKVLVFPCCRVLDANKGTTFCDDIDVRRFIALVEYDLLGLSQHYQESADK